jgi:hypothetical protein
VGERMADLNMFVWLGMGIFVGIIVLSFGCFLFFLSKYRKSEERTKIQVAFLIFFLCLGIVRSILLYYDYLYNVMEIQELVIWKISNIFLMGGIGSIIFASENGVFKGKDFYGFLIGFLILFSISIVYPDIPLSQSFMLSAMIFALFIPISYIYLAYKFPVSRKNIVLMFAGFGIFIVGLFSALSAVVEMYTAVLNELYLIGAIIQAVGFSLFAIGIKRMYFAR